MPRFARLICVLTVFCGVALPSGAFAQLSATLTVNVSEVAGLYTYDYTLQNSLLSAVSANSLILSVAKGDAVVRTLPDDELPPTEGRRISAPDNWVGVYQPYEVELGDNCETLGFRTESGQNVLSARDQVVWLAGNGATLDVEDFDVFPGDQLQFTLQSRYGPAPRDYFIAKLFGEGCGDALGFLDGKIDAPDVPPPSTGCDFDGDGDCDLTDIDLLASNIVTQSGDSTFDLTSDGLVNTADLTAFLVDSKVNKLNGDTDFDNEVAFQDFLVLSNNFGSPAAWSGGDFDADGAVGFADFLILSDNFGKSTLATAAVPEPSTSLLAGAGVAILGLLRRKT